MTKDNKVLTTAFGILGPIESEQEDTRSWLHSNHTQLQMVRQKV